MHTPLKSTGYHSLYTISSLLQTGLLGKSYLNFFLYRGLHVAGASSQQLYIQTMESENRRKTGAESP